jgi:hypothetical protein
MTAKQIREISRKRWDSGMGHVYGHVYGLLSELATDNERMQGEIDELKGRRSVNHFVENSQGLCGEAHEEDFYMIDKSNVTCPRCLEILREREKSELPQAIKYCPKCGKSRCPKAGNPDFKCTNSNAVGQVGELEKPANTRGEVAAENMIRARDGKWISFGDDHGRLIKTQYGGEIRDELIADMRLTVAEAIADAIAQERREIVEEIKQRHSYWNHPKSLEAAIIEYIQSRKWPHMIQLPVYTTDLPRKPLPGKPCNGCGLCCHLARCPVSIDLIGEGDGPCPALEYSDGRYWCGIVLHPRKYVAQIPEAARLSDAQLQVCIGHLMNFGYGCDCTMPSLDGTD